MRCKGSARCNTTFWKIVWPRHRAASSFNCRHFGGGKCSAKTANPLVVRWRRGPGAREIPAPDAPASWTCPAMAPADATREGGDCPDRDLLHELQLRKASIPSPIIHARPIGEWATARSRFASSRGAEEEGNDRESLQVCSHKLLRNAPHHSVTCSSTCQIGGGPGFHLFLALSSTALWGQ